jgi:hypothetical protein
MRTMGSTIELEERGCGSFRVREAGPLAPPVTFIMQTPVVAVTNHGSAVDSRAGDTGILSFPGILPTDVGISSNNCPHRHIIPSLCPGME